MNIVCAVVIPLSIFVLVSVVPIFCNFLCSKKSIIYKTNHSVQSVIEEQKNTILENLTVDGNTELFIANNSDINKSQGDIKTNEVQENRLIIEERIYVDKPRIILQRIIENGEEKVILKI